MRRSREASPNLFVVRGLPLGRLQELAGPVPEVEGVEELDAERGLLLLRLRSGKREPRAAWRLAQEIVGDWGTVTPVLVNGEGRKSYTIGTIHVRFRKVPSDADLEAFARAHRLHLVARNRYQPVQASFELLEPRATYLPDAVARLGGARGVRMAWAEVLSVYRRS